MSNRGHARGAEDVRVRQISGAFPVVDIGGFPGAAPVPALVQALPGFTWRRAIAVVDSALHREVIRREDLHVIRRGLKHRIGAPGLGQWWRFVDGRAASPMETYARLDCHQSGLPAPKLHVELRDGTGAAIARSDLGWRRKDGTWLLVEIDRRDFHTDPHALFEDRWRQNRILADGRHTILRFTGRDVMDGRVAPTVSRFLLREYPQGA